MCSNRPALVFLVVLVMFSGCASSPVTEVPEPGLHQIPDGHGRIFVYRLNGDADGISSAVRVAGDPIGRAIPGSYFYVDLPVGQHEIAAARNSKQTVVVDVAAGTEYFLRVDIWLNATRWMLTPVPVPEETARAQMNSLSYKGQ